MILTQPFIEAIRRRRTHYFRLETASLSWDKVFDWLDMYDAHDQKYISISDRGIGRINFYPVFDLNKRHLPPFVAQIKSEWTRTFDRNNVSCQVFANWHKDAESFPKHKDPMDVCYIQCHGSVVLRVSHEEDSPSIFSRQLDPGDGIWIPRGKWHHIEVKGPRIGLSVGVENPKIDKNTVDLDPSSYI